MVMTFRKQAIGYKEVKEFITCISDGDMYCCGSGIGTCCSVLELLCTRMKKFLQGILYSNRIKCSLARKEPVTE